MKPMWNSLRHEPMEGALERRLCQAGKHEDEPRMPPPAGWLEMIWLPRVPLEDARVYSAWFTCEACHQEMLDTREEVEAIHDLRADG